MKDEFQKAAQDVVVSFKLPFHYLLRETEDNGDKH
jgi:hypothetical protein